MECGRELDLQSKVCCVWWWEGMRQSRNWSPEGVIGDGANINSTRPALPPGKGPKAQGAFNAKAAPATEEESISGGVRANDWAQQGAYPLIAPHSGLRTSGRVRTSPPVDQWAARRGDRPPQTASCIGGVDPAIARQGSGDEGGSVDKGVAMKGWGLDKGVAMKEGQGSGDEGD